MQRVLDADCGNASKHQTADFVRTRAHPASVGAATYPGFQHPGTAAGSSSRSASELQCAAGSAPGACSPSAQVPAAPHASVAAGVLAHRASAGASAGTSCTCACAVVACACRHARQRGGISKTGMPPATRPALACFWLRAAGSSARLAKHVLRSLCSFAWRRFSSWRAACAGVQAKTGQHRSCTMQQWGTRLQCCDCNYQWQGISYLIQHTCTPAGVKGAAEVLWRTCSAALRRFASLASRSPGCLRTSCSLPGRLCGSALPTPGG